MPRASLKRLAPVLVALIALGALVAWRLAQKKEQKAALLRQRLARTTAAAHVVVVAAQIRDIVATFEATGSLEAPLSVQISPKVTGRVVFLEVHEGDRIRRGQVLVRIDSDEVEAQVRQQEAAVAEAEYRLAQAELIQTPTDTSVATQIKQQAAAVDSAAAEYNQARENLQSQIAAAASTVTDTQGRVDAATAAIANARASIKSAQANLDNATIRYDRTYELYKQAFAAAQDVDDAKATVAVQRASLEVAQGQLQSAIASRNSAVAQKQAAEEQLKIVEKKGAADVEAARQQLNQAKAALEYAQSNTAQTPAYVRSLEALRASVAATRQALNAAKAQRAYTVLAAPMDGAVTARYVDPGSVIAPGQPALAVQYFDRIWVSIAVPDTVSARTHLGQEVAAAFDALPGRPFTARVVQINPSADPEGRQFTVRAGLDNREGVLKPGMFAPVTVVTERVPHVIAVPREAVGHDESGAFVNVVGPDSKVQHRSVAVGASDAAFIAISRGLQAGENVVVLSAAALKEGQAVRVGTPSAAEGQPQGAPAHKP